MSKTLKLSDVTSKKLRAGYYKDIIPEFYDLKNSTENSSWHINQNVFDHAVGVFEGLETVLLMRFVDKKTKEKISNYLRQRIGNLRRKEILTASTILHDIAKVDGVVTNPDGSAAAPGHEIIGAHRVKDFTKRLELGKKDYEYTKRIVTYHGFVNSVLSLIIYTGNLKKYTELFKKIAGDIHIELCLLMYADILGSDLARSSKKEYKNRLLTLKKILEDG